MSAIQTLDSVNLCADGLGVNKSLSLPGLFPAIYPQNRQLIDHRGKPGYDSKMATFNNTGFLWKRGAVAADRLNLPHSQSSRHVEISTEIIEACQNALSDVLPGAFPTRSTLFSKSSVQSWSLAWHQDRVIAVAEKHDMPSYTNWTRKDGIWHVEPPIEVLNKMVFVQVYLDDVGLDDGPTELASSTHKFGKICGDEKETIIAQTETHPCLASKGDVLICRALILHRSLITKTQNPRRILRIDFANFELPEPLSWNPY